MQYLGPARRKMAGFLKQQYWGSHAIISGIKTSGVIKGEMMKEGKVLGGSTVLSAHF